MKVGDIVQFNTNCIWDKCSGTVHKISKEIIGVTLPDGITKLGFTRNELKVCN
jgi:hypothetical protein